MVGSLVLASYSVNSEVNSAVVNTSISKGPAEVDIPLNRDIFLRSLIRELSGTLEDVVGLKEASGFISVVGQNVGDQMNQDYRSALQVSSLSREQVAQVLVDLKRRIEGDFFIIEETDRHIVLGNRACPFGDKVLNRTSMCMMTSNVFGAIAAENLGYAKVELQQTIANGDPGCRVVVHLSPTAEAEAAEGREYFRTES
jgi:predicted ArsR family transcriptional regulator